MKRLSLIVMLAVVVMMNVGHDSGDLDVDSNSNDILFIDCTVKKKFISPELEPSDISNTLESLFTYFDILKKD